jgi:hypothetical protein
VPAFPMIVPDTGEPVKRTIGVSLPALMFTLVSPDAEAVARLSDHMT